MNCRECQMQIPEYVDGVLAGNVLRRTETHLRACPACAAALAGERAALARFAGLLAPGLQRRELAAPIRARIAVPGRVGAASRPAVFFAQWPAKIRLLAMAASVLILASAPFIFEQTSRQRPANQLHWPVLAVETKGLEMTNTLSQLIMVACLSNASEQLAVNIVHRVTW